MAAGIIFSVIVLTHDRPRALESCLNSLLRQSYKPREVIIIDTGKKDKNENIIQTFKKKYKLLRYFRLVGADLGEARNYGLKMVKGKIIAFTDDDCIVEGDWLKKINKIFLEYGCDAVGGSILNVHETKFSTACHILNFSSWYPTGKIRFVKDIPTANIAYKKSSIKNVRFPVSNGLLGYEDSFFNFNLIHLNKKILFDPDIKVFHDKPINNYNSFLENQRFKGKSFLKRGYKVHGLIGKLLIKFKILNLLCPRIVFVFYRHLKSRKYLLQFVKYSPLILRGEFERGMTILKCK